MEFPFERDAMKNKPLPEGLDVADSCCYMCLKMLYNMYRRGEIDLAAAKKEKENIVFNWTKDKSKLKFLDRESETLRDTIGAASERYKAEPTVENADALYAAFYHLPKDWRKK